MFIPFYFCPSSIVLSVTLHCLIPFSVLSSEMLSMQTANRCVSDDCKGCFTRKGKTYPFKGSDLIVRQESLL